MRSKRTVPRASPVRLVLILAVSILVTEALVMFVLSYLPPLSVPVGALFDSTFLVVLLSPMLYFFLFRPMVMRIAERERAEEALGPSLEATTESRRTAEEIQHQAGRLAVMHEIDVGVLAARSVQEIARAATDRIREILPCDHAMVNLAYADRIGGIVGSVGDEGPFLAHNIRIGLEDLGAWVEMHKRGLPYVVEDLELIVDRSPVLEGMFADGFRSIISVPFMLDGRPAGALTLSAKTPGAFEAEHLATARELADSLTVAIAQTRLREEQGALADLGQRALVATDLPLFLDHVVALVARTLDVEYAKILELLPDGQELLLRSGVGWREGFVGRATVPAGTGSQAGYTLLSDEPVVVEDFSTEARFSSPPLLREHGVVSGVSVIVRGRERPFGVLGVHTSRRRTFASDSVNFVQSVANVLAEVIERGRAERSLRESERSLARAQAIAHLGSWEWDIVTNDVSWSDEIFRIFGLTPREFTPTNGAFLSSVHPDDRAMVNAAVRAAVDERSPYGIDHRIVLPDGSERVVHEQAEVIFDEIDHPVRMVGTTQDVTERKRAEEELEEGVDMLRKVDLERRRLVAHLVNAQEEERARIASDIHDDPLQKITALGMRVGILKRELEDPEQKERVEEIERTVSLTADSLRHLLFEVRPLALDREGLAAALREYLDQAAADAGFTFSLEDGLVEEPAPETRILCYRVAQEALANVKVHAGASRVEIALASQEAGVRVRIRDDGVGFVPDAFTAVSGHLGLHDMRERVQLAGGWLRIDSSPGAGTSVEFWVSSGVPGE